MTTVDCLAKNGNGPNKARPGVSRSIQGYNVNTGLALERVCTGLGSERVRTGLGLVSHYSRLIGRLFWQLFHTQLFRNRR